MQPSRHFVQCLSPAGLHRMAYQQWGDPENPKVLICVHGVTRVGADFDALAARLQKDYRIICPDVVGRGYSDSLKQAGLYQIPQYVSDMVSLIARLDVPQVHWVGTSMGGLIGMVLAGLENSPISRLVINDVGPNLDAQAMNRIADYIGQDMRFESFDQALVYIKAISASFGPHDDAQWDKLARDVLRQNPDGSWRKHYDLKLAEPVRAITPELAQAAQAMLWASYDAIRCPVLLLRGAESDLLTRQTAEQMSQRGPHARMVEFAGVGHAPTLLAADQIDAVSRFLLEG